MTIDRVEEVRGGTARTPPEAPSGDDRRAAVDQLEDLLDFFENGAVCLHWIDSDGTILKANRAELDLLGYEAEEYVGRNIAEFHVDWATIDDVLARLRRGETVRNHEARLRCKDGSIRHVLIDSNVLRRGGEFVHTRCFTRDNTERKRLEEQLATSRVQLEEGLSALSALYNLAPMGIAIAPDPDCRRIEVNPALAEMLQIPAGSNAALNVANGERPCYRVLQNGKDVGWPFEQAARDGVTVERGAYDIVRADGSTRTIFGFASPLLDAKGNARGSVGAFIDITERKAAEHALRESETKARAVLESAVDAIITIDANGTIESVNPATEKLFGYAADEIIGRNVSVLMPAPYREEHDGYVRNYIDSGVAKVIGIGREVEGRRKDGSTFAMHLTVSEVQLGGRTRFTGIVQDISERKRIDDAMRDSEHRYRSLAETIPALITLSNARGEIEYCNARMLEYTGLSYEALRAGEWVRIFHPDDVETNRAEWERAIRGNEQITSEFRARRYDGVYRWHLGRLTPLRDDDGKITGWLGAHVDIDDQKRTLGELQEALAVKDEFLGLVSHELKTPITTILGNAQILHKRLNTIDTDARALALGDIAAEADRLHRIIENMLVLARLDSGRDLELEPLQLEHAIRPLAHLHEQRHPHRKVELEIEPQLPIVGAEAGYVEQVLNNLLSNAEKYSRHDETIIVRACRSGNEVSVSVLDRGPGIAPEEAEEIFAPFYRSPRTAEAVKGIGIGLTVCKRLIEAQGGRMFAQQRDGGGSEIGFTLLIEDEQAEA